MYTKQLFSFLLLSPLLMTATVHAQKRKMVKTQQTLATLYADSLSTYRQKINSLTAANDSLQDLSISPVTNFKMFSPLNFYHDVPGERLRLDDGAVSGNTVNTALMDIYMRRPELVKSTDNTLSQSGDVAEEVKDVANVTRKELKKFENAKGGMVDSGMADIGGASVNMYVSKPNFWKYSGDYNLQFMQNHVSENWYKGGTDNYSLMGIVTLNYNYNNKQKVKWDNKLEMRLGLQNTDNDTVNRFKTNEDLIRYTSSFGLQALKDWYYTMKVIASTQFAQGRKDNTKDVYSDFMSPFDLSVSLGMDYAVRTSNNRLTGNIHIAPLAFGFRYVARENLAKSFGIDNGHKTKEDFGSQLLAELEWRPWDMFKWRTRLYAFTSYHRVLAEWENTLTFQFNRYISTNVFLYPRFDDSDRKADNYWQFKEYLSLGFSYSM